MVDIDYLIVTYIVSLFVDWIFQTDWQAINKSKWNKNDNREISLIALSSHSMIYASITSLIVFIILKLNHMQYIITIITLFISHFIIDSRIPVKWIMRRKGMTYEQINDTVNYGFMHIGIDQRLHEVVIFILALFI
jgi:hypothetical protein